MLDIYDKDEKEDLSTDEKKILKELAEQLKQEVSETAKRAKRKDDTK
jgi:hypothetical protein